MPGTNMLVSTATESTLKGSRYYFQPPQMHPGLRTYQVKIFSALVMCLVDSAGHRQLPCPLQITTHMSILANQTRIS